MSGPKLVLMGYEKILYIGTAGSTAATQVLDVVNLKVTIDAQYGSTKSRGDGNSVPIKTSRPVERSCVVSFNTLRVPANTNHTTMLTAASAQTGIAMKVVDVASGAVEFDGDVYLKVDKDAQLSAEQDHAYTSEATRDYGRDPTF